MGGSQHCSSQSSKHTPGEDEEDEQYPKGPCLREMWADVLRRLKRKKYQVQFGDVIVVMKKFLLTPISGIPYSSNWFNVPRMAQIKPTGLVFDAAIRT